MTPSDLRISSSPARGSRGTVLIEFGLVLPFLFVMTLTVVDLSRAYFLKNMVSAAAREGVREAVVQPVATSGPGYDAVYARVTGVLQSTGLIVPQANVVVTALDIGSGAPDPDHYKVTVTTQFSWLYLGLLNLFGASITNPQTLTASAVMLKE